MLKKVFALGATLLNRPMQVLVICFGLSFLGLTLDGSLLRLWLLRQEEGDLRGQIVAHQKQIDGIRAQITRAKDPRSMERDARDRFDLAGENDLIFVFSQETP